MSRPEAGLPPTSTDSGPLDSSSWLAECRVEGPGGASVAAAEGGPGSGPGSARAGLSLLFGDNGRRAGVDPATGTQVVICGLIHERGELSSELRAAGTDIRDWRCAAQPALALAAYRHWGDDFVRRLAGTFAVILWDPRAGRLLAARDRVGMHPLFFAGRDGAWVFSSDQRTLVGRGGVQRKPNRVAIVSHFATLYPDKTETFLAGVRRLPPGHRLSWSRGSVSMARYWDPIPDGPIASWPRDADPERFEFLFERAVRRCMGEAPCALFMSGGIDSLSVALVAARVRAREARSSPQALSLAFDALGPQEIATQREMSVRLGLAQRLVPVDESVADGAFIRANLALAGTWDAPIQFLWLSSYVALARSAVAEGGRTILTGSGGDEWLGISPVLSADLMRDFEFRRIAALLRAFRASYRLPPASHLRNFLWTNGLRPIVRSALLPTAMRWIPDLVATRRRRHRQRMRPAWLAPEPDLLREYNDRREAELDRLEAERMPASYYGHELRRGLDHPLVSSEYEEWFEFSRQTGALRASPYFDADLIEFLAPYPPEHLVIRGRHKGLAREMLDRAFPDLEFHRQRKDHAIPYHRDVVMREAPGLYRETGRMQQLVRLGILDSDALDRALELSSKGDEQGGVAPWALHQLFTFDAWLQSLAPAGSSAKDEARPDLRAIT